MAKTACKSDKINGRISEIREYFCNGNNKEFAEKLSISTPRASNMCNGEPNIGKETIEKLLTTFPEVSRAWLVLGEGTMLATPSADVSHQGDVRDSTVIYKMGDNNGSISGAAMEQLLKSKDDTIAMLKDRIEELKQRIEDQRHYIAVLSDEHRSLIHKTYDMVSDNNTKLASIEEHARMIGFKVDGDEHR